MLREERNNRELNINDLCYAFQHRSVEELMKRVHLALDKVDVKTFALAGGVAANSLLRENILNLEQKYPELNVLIPPFWACMDQAAMIGLAAEVYYRHGITATCEISALSNKSLNDN